MQDSKGATRRQQRGLEQIERLLLAAGHVFAETGYEGATTNAIAARADVSPGTLYQFFRNKQQIAEALADRYAEGCRRAKEEAIGRLPSGRVPAARVVDHVVDPLLRFHREAPGFEALLSGSVISADLSARIAPLDEELHQSLKAMLLLRYPHLGQKEADTAAATSQRLFKAMLQPALTGSPAAQRRGAQELKTVLLRYIAPLERHGKSSGAKKA
jgi:AcrR family transcriptional regulator